MGRLMGDPAGTPPRMLSPELADQRASTSARRRRGLVRGRRDRSVSPGAPSARNRFRYECSDCREVPYREATFPIGEPPSTSATAR